MVGQVAAPKALDELTEPMRAALRRAEAHGIPVSNPRSAGVQPATIAALERHGLIAKRATHKQPRPVWRPTDVGRGLLAAPVPQERRFLARGVGYTARREHALGLRGPDGLLEVEEGLDEQELAGLRRDTQSREEQRLEQLLDARRGRPPAERLALVLRDAAARRVDVESQLRVVRSRLDRMERDVYRVADRTLDADPGGAG
jgi:hypothetical protein